MAEPDASIDVRHWLVGKLCYTIACYQHPRGTEAKRKKVVRIAKPIWDLLPHSQQVAVTGHATRLGVELKVT